jgi:magnesium chelatase subunit D
MKEWQGNLFIDKHHSLTKTHGKHKNVAHRGPYVGVRPFKDKERYSDIALDASLRAAALHSVQGIQYKKEKFFLRPWDLRKKVRKGRGASFVIFVVDSSDSMSIRAQMAIAKGVIISLLAGAYKRDDRVALVTFRDRHASAVLYPTKSISLARERLKKLPTGGTTPFAHGILKAYQLIKGEKAKNPGTVPVMVILSDGEANVPYKPMEDCMKEMKVLGTLVRKEKIKILAIDTKPEGRGIRPEAEMKRIARFLGAHYMHIDDIGVRKVVETIRDEVM